MEPAIPYDNNYDRWHESINEDNLVWIDYYDSSLCSIYEFIDEAAKKTAFCQAYDTLLANNVLSTPNGEVDLDLKIVKFVTNANDGAGDYLEFYGTISFEAGGVVKYLLDIQRNNTLDLHETTTTGYDGPVQTMRSHSLNDSFTIKVRMREADAGADPDDPFTDVDKVFTLKDLAGADLEMRTVNVRPEYFSESLTIYIKPTLRSVK